MSEQSRTIKNSQSIKIAKKQVNMLNATQAEAAVLLKIQNEEMISKAIRNSTVKLERTIEKILDHSANKGKSPEDILDILANKTRKGKGGEALVAISYNENAFKAGRLHPHSLEPGDVFAIVNPRSLETGRDVLFYKVDKKGNQIEIAAQEIKTGSEYYAINQSQNGKYPDIITNTENVTGESNGKIYSMKNIEGVETNPYSEADAIEKTKKVLKRQYKEKKAVTFLDEAKFLAIESAKAGARSAVFSGSITLGMELGGDLIQGNEIDEERVEEITKKVVKGAGIAAADTVAKTVTAKLVSKSLSSKGGQVVVKRVMGKTASKVLAKNAGKIAGPAGGFIIDSIVDVTQAVRGKQSAGKAAVNVGLNAANATLYIVFPPAAIGMTIVRIGGSIIWGW